MGIIVMAFEDVPRCAALLPTKDVTDFGIGDTPLDDRGTKGEAATKI
jgi:hypothetical protein